MIRLGLKARHDVEAALTREQIAATGGMSRPGATVRAPDDARELAEVIRRATIDAAGGLPYSKTPPYLAPDGEPTTDAAKALIDERTGRPVPNPSYSLWVQATTLQTALMQAYIGFRVAEFTAAVGAAFVLTGLGFTLAGKPA